MEDNLLKLWQTTLIDLGVGCVREISTTHDWETVMRRFETEGLAFLTLTLPAFGKDFEKSLAEEQVSADHFRGWAKTPGHGSGRIPRFLSGFLGRIFDRETGRLLDQPDEHSVFAVRQLTLMYAKILIPCSDARIKAAIDSYVECEKEVRRSDCELTTEMVDEFVQSSSVLYSGVFQAVDEDVYYGRIIPKHGPGATADRLKGNQKFDQVEWTERLETVFPFGEHLVPNYRYHFDILSRVNFLEPGAERPVKVITVPKTQKTPRIIAVEPTCMQYVQQGLMEKFVNYLESPIVRWVKGKPEANLGFGLVGFSDQTPNQRMAREGSLTGSLATLDLSEASDRVSYQLVRAMLERYPHLQEGVDACRSRKADVPGVGVIRLSKFASMGSALTFPIEAMVFSTLAMMGIAKALNRPVSRRLCEEMEGLVRVYGDDIIVPNAYAESVIVTLEAFGFKVNKNKSFWTGKFRESCGKEYYAGSDVSIARVRRVLPTSLTHVEEIISTVSLRNQLYQLGLWQTAGYLDDLLVKALKGRYPIVEETSPGIGRISVCFEPQGEKQCEFLHRPLVKAYVTNSKIPPSRIDGLAALLKCFLKRGEEPFADEEHLLRGGRPEAVNIKLRWISPV